MDNSAPENSKREGTLKRILIYTGITFALTYAYGFGLLPALSAKASSGGQLLTVLYQLAYTGIMFFPAIGALLTRLITREGFRNHYLAPHLKGNFRAYLLAWFAPFVCTILGALVWFLVRPDSFDADMGFLTAQLNGQELPIPGATLLLIQTVEALLLAPVLNAVPSFGEEWGWRGYLVPKLDELCKPLPTVLISGVIWGLWHAPVIALGHNYGLDYPSAPFGGILMMCVFTTFAGVLMAYVTIRTKSCLPAVIAHGMLNGIASLGAFFTADGGNLFLGPLPTGIVGMSGFIALAVILLILWRKREGKLPETGAEQGEPLAK